LVPRQRHREKKGKNFWPEVLAGDMSRRKVLRTKGTVEKKPWRKKGAKPNNRRWDMCGDLR